MTRSPCPTLLSACVLLGFSAAAPAATYVVDTSSDNAALSACTPAPADCSLRGAITRANADVAVDAIEFAIPASDPGCDVDGICRIEAVTPFSISRGLSIDGYTQTGAQPNTIPAPGPIDAQLKIELTSTGFANFATPLFQLQNGDASPFSLSGLAMVLPTSAIVSGGLRHDHRGNAFCVDARGQSPQFTQPCSALVLSGFNRTIRIGGPDPADRNVIAGGGRDLNGAPGGGTSTLRVNSVSAETGSILLQGNLIGLAPDGITAFPMRDPLLVNTGDDAFATPDIRLLDNRFARPRRNFSGGFGGALRFSVNRTMSESALIQGNVFGLGTDGSVVGVEKDHIEIFLGNNSRVPRVLVGGLLPGQGNIFAGGLPQSATGLSLGSAVILPSGNVNTSVEFVGNTMLGNAGIGLDFPTATAGGGVAVGHTPNDPGDPDSGANLQQNFPRILDYLVGAGTFSVRYRVDSAPENSAYPLRVDFYRALGDEGEVLLDSDVYLEVEAQTDKQVGLTIPPGVSLTVDDVIVAIATDAQGRSSEFSFDTATVTVADTPDPWPAGLPFEAEVIATATSGPFKPNGVATVSLATSPPTTCEATLAPTANAGLSRGVCSLVATAVGTRTLTATLDPLRSAFARADGGAPSASTQHTATDPGPERVGFTHCRGTALEGRELEVFVARPSGGVASVSVQLSHEPGSASAGVDYTPPADQVLSWAPGDLAPKRIAIAVAADAPAEPAETFRLRLSAPSGAALLPFALLEVRIVDGEERGFDDGFEGDCPN
jgi:hypothetical protein